MQCVSQLGESNYQIYGRNSLWSSAYITFRLLNLIFSITLNHSLRPPSNGDTYIFWAFKRLPLSFHAPCRTMHDPPTTIQDISIKYTNNNPKIKDITIITVISIVWVLSTRTSRFSSSSWIYVNHEQTVDSYSRRQALNSVNLMEGVEQPRISCVRLIRDSTMSKDFTSVCWNWECMLLIEASLNDWWKGILVGVDVQTHKLASA